MGAVLIDTSVIYALLVADDRNHRRAVQELSRLREDDAALVTTSYVLHEATALLQARVGLDAVRDLHESLRPLLDVIWIARDVHDHAMNTMLAARTKGISLTDWTSFGAMKAHGIVEAFAFDRDFRKRGFRTRP